MSRDQEKETFGIARPSPETFARDRNEFCANSVTVTHRSIACELKCLQFRLRPTFSCVPHFSMEVDVVAQRMTFHGTRNAESVTLGMCIIKSTSHTRSERHSEPSLRNVHNTCRPCRSPFFTVRDRKNWKMPATALLPLFCYFWGGG